MWFVRFDSTYLFGYLLAQSGLVYQYAHRSRQSISVFVGNVYFCKYFNQYPKTTFFAFHGLVLCVGWTKFVVLHCPKSRLRNRYASRHQFWRRWRHGSDGKPPYLRQKCLYWLSCGSNFTQKRNPPIVAFGHLWQYFGAFFGHCSVPINGNYVGYWLVFLSLFYLQSESPYCLQKPKMGVWLARLFDILLYCFWGVLFVDQYPF